MIAAATIIAACVLCWLIGFAIGYRLKRSPVRALTDHRHKVLVEQTKRTLRTALDQLDALR